MRQAFLLVVVVAITLVRAGAEPGRDRRAGAADCAHGSVGVSPALGRPRRRRQHVVHGAAESRRRDAGVQFPASRRHPGGLRHRPSFPQRRRGDVRDPRRRGAVHDRRPHGEREGAGWRPLPDRPLACDLQPGADAGAVDEPERVARRRRLRQRRSRRHPRRRGARCGSHVHDDSTGPVAAASGGRTRTWSASAPPAPNAVLSRRVAGPAMFSTTWSYIDHVLVPPGASTPELRA